MWILVLNLPTKSHMWPWVVGLSKMSFRKVGLWIVAPGFLFLREAVKKIQVPERQNALWAGRYNGRLYSSCFFILCFWCFDILGLCWLWRDLPSQGELIPRDSQWLTCRPIDPEPVPPVTSHITFIPSGWLFSCLNHVTAGTRHLDTAPLPRCPGNHSK